MKQEGNVINEIFGTFPREFGKKRRFVTNRTDFYYLANTYNGMMNLYSTIYNVEKKGEYENSIIDKIYLDLDAMLMMTSTEPLCWISTWKLHDYLMEKDLKHLILLTGRGFAVYIYAQTIKLNNPKAAIENAQRFIADEVKLTIGDHRVADIDWHIIGDIARISRIPNTWNLKAKRYCIPLIAEDFDKEYDEICMLAEKQRFEFEIFGSKLLDLLGFDTIKSKVDIEPLEFKEIPKDAPYESHIRLLPPLIRTLLLTTRCGWRDRYLEILAIREAGIPKKMCYMIAQKYWTPEKFNHAIKEEDQIEYIYNRRDLMFPKWETLENEGYYISDEDRKYKFYKERY